MVVDEPPGPDPDGAPAAARPQVRPGPAVETGAAEVTTPPASPGRPPRPEDIRDELPEDLDAAGFVGPYVFPNNSRRRVPGALYLLIAAGLVAVWALSRGSALVNGGFLLAAVLLAAAGAYSLVSGWDLTTDERDALVAATADVGFPVGHASAQMGWRGLLSRPTWRILLYSAENPPAKRALVLVDGATGTVLERIVEDNPEDWSDLVDEHGRPL